jgi:hypothetical protein
MHTQGQLTFEHMQLHGPRTIQALPEGWLGEEESDIWKCVEQHLTDYPQVEQWLTWQTLGDIRVSFAHWQMPAAGFRDYPILFTCGVHSRFRGQGLLQAVMRAAIVKLAGDFDCATIGIAWGTNGHLRACHKEKILAGLGPIKLVDIVSGVDRPWPA